MYRVALIAPVVSSAEPDLSSLLAADPYALRDDLSVPFDQWVSERPGEQAVLSLIHEHESYGASLLPDRLLVAERVVPAAASALGVSDVFVSVGLHGVMAMVLWVDLLDLDTLAQVEEALSPLVTEMAVEVRQHLRSSPAVTLVSATRVGRYPRDQFLYWHRVLVAERAEVLWSDRLCDDIEAPVAQPAVVRLGDGYTTVSGASAATVRDVLRGLVRAQELWLVVTTVSQQLLIEIARLTQPHVLTLEELAAEQQRAVELADAEALRNGVVRDEITYMTGTVRTVVRAAADAWQLELDTTRVGRRLDVLLDVLQRRVAEQQSRQQERLNGIVLALTVVGALALVLGLFETSVGNDVGSVDVLRLCVSAVVGSLAVTSIVLALRRRRRPAHQAQAPH